MNTDQLARLINSVLNTIELGGSRAVALLLGTAAQESAMGTYIYQINGPARGIFQMEPTTEFDIWENYIHYRNKLRDKLFLLGIVDEDLIPKYHNLEGNIVYQIALCRIHYLRISEPLPQSNDIKSLAHYWKVYYNTYKGKGNEIEFQHNYEKYSVAKSVQKLFPYVQ